MKNIIVLSFILSFTFLYGQTTEYSGVVKAKSDKLPLPGATVLVKGTKIGTQTDFDGNFKISVPDFSKVLTISYLGFKMQEIRLDGLRLVEIYLKKHMLQSSLR